MSNNIPRPPQLPLFNLCFQLFVPLGKGLIIFGEIEKKVLIVSLISLWTVGTRGVFWLLTFSLVVKVNATSGRGVLSARLGVQGVSLWTAGVDRLLVMRFSSVMRA